MATMLCAGGPLDRRVVTSARLDLFLAHIDDRWWLYQSTGIVWQPSPDSPQQEIVWEPGGQPWDVLEVDELPPMPSRPVEPPVETVQPVLGGDDEE